MFSYFTVPYGIRQEGNRRKGEPGRIQIQHDTVAQRNQSPNEMESHIYDRENVVHQNSDQHELLPALTISMHYIVLVHVRHRAEELPYDVARLPLRVRSAYVKIATGA
mmetsp:Transcript_17131/g.49534  ORF Transcript_17131/g.49534 Transcript_17131/m.49534 type:complete len:108 (+) Transcript_17131:1263-1586(+)